VNGKVRDKLEVAADITEAEAKRLALESPRVVASVDGTTIRDVIYIEKAHLVNVVAR
jgi:leucyl-tRNA synthetase